MGRNLLTALIASLVVAAPLAFGSMTIASGNLSEIMKHPYFWTFYAKSLFWFFLVGFAASALTVALVGRKK